MTDRTQPEALRLAEQYDHGDPATHGNAWKAAICAELRRQYARIAELESELEAVGAGGVQALSAAHKAAPQQEAQEPCWWAADQVRIEKTEKNGWCAYLDIQDADGNCTGTINLCRGINSENAARALVQNWVREFVPEPKQVAAPQQEAQEPCQTCIAMARTVMLDQVSFDRKPDAYGIRQITDDDGVEEWEDIRTSPDVAREEANDMMATGRGEIYEVVPLWTTPQPAPAPLSDDTERLEWLLWKLPGDALRYVVGELSDTSSGAEFRAAIDAALAAQGGK